MLICIERGVRFKAEQDELGLELIDQHTLVLSWIRHAARPPSSVDLLMCSSNPEKRNIMMPFVTV